MTDFIEHDDVYQVFRDDFDREINTGCLTLWSSISEYIHNVHPRFVMSSAEYVDFQEDLHVVWYMFIRAAQSIDAESAEQDRLHSQLVLAKELGALTKKDDLVVFRSPWLNLPYLLDDFQSAWVKASRQLSPVQRRNFAAFTARLLALGTCDVKISLCALWLLRETLEVSRPVQPTLTDQDPSVSDMISAVVELFKVSSTKLLKLSVHQWIDGRSNTVIATPGDLAMAQNVQQSGFSIPRWVVWRKRLGELCYYRDSGSVAVNARSAFDYMIITGRTLGYEIEGEKSYWTRVERELAVELKRSGKPSVSLTDIVTEPTWADEAEPTHETSVEM